MKKLTVLLITFAFFNVTNVAMADTIYINDGDTHIINDATYQNDTVILDDPSGSTWPGTHVDLIDGGIVGTDLWSRRYSTVTMAGGVIGRSLSADDNAMVTVSGGSISTLVTFYNGLIYLGGSNFEVDGQPLSDGDKLSDFGTLTEYRPYPDIISDYYYGTITGTLSDGSVINSEFYIYKIGFFNGGSDIIIGLPCFYLLAGDLDGNCKVDLADFALMASNWLADCYQDPTSPGCEYSAAPP